MLEYLQICLNLQKISRCSISSIVSSARALKLICKKWQRYNKLPDAVIVEGPLSGGHQGFTYEQCFQEEYQLENIVPSVIEEAKIGEIFL